MHVPLPGCNVGVSLEALPRAVASLLSAATLCYFLINFLTNILVAWERRRARGWHHHHQRLWNDHGLQQAGFDHVWGKAMCVHFWPCLAPTMLAFGGPFPNLTVTGACRASTHELHTAQTRPTLHLHRDSRG